MPVEIGEAREAWGWNVWKKAEDIANTMKASERPFYIVYAAKSDRKAESTFRQAFKMYKSRPPKILGVLVWFVDKEGEFNFVPDLSLPPDVPIDPSLLSDKACDAFSSVMEKGEKECVLLS